MIKYRRLSLIPDSMKEAEFVRIAMIDESTDKCVQSVVVTLPEADRLIGMEILEPESLLLIDEPEVPLHIWAIGDADMYESLLEEQWGYSR